MDDLISRKALLAAYDERHKGPPGGARELIEDAPTVPAVPLDKLCEWLAVHGINIPCESCSHFSNDRCTVIGDMDTPCPNKAKDWKKAIKEWMEGLE